MRLAALGALAVGLGAMLSACAPYSPTQVDPEIAAERGAAGAVLGAALGAGLGATAAINPPLGAAIGAEAGAALGAAAGIMTTPPPPTYEPVALPADAAIPGYYDSWPPGYYRPVDNPETRSPHDG
jgi:hypothetical protein